MSGGERGGEYTVEESVQGDASRQLRSGTVSRADWRVVTERSDNSQDAVEVFSGQTGHGSDSVTTITEQKLLSCSLSSPAPSAMEGKGPISSEFSWMWLLWVCVCVWMYVCVCVREVILYRVCLKCEDINPAAGGSWQDVSLNAGHGVWHRHALRIQRTKWSLMSVTVLWLLCNQSRDCAVCKVCVWWLLGGSSWVRLISRGPEGRRKSSSGVYLACSVFVLHVSERTRYI